MIVIQVELWSHGDAKKKKSLGTMVIKNDGTGTNSRGNYQFFLHGKSGRPMGSGGILDWPRNRFHVWQLIHHILGQKYN